MDFKAHQTQELVSNFAIENISKAEVSNKQLHSLDSCVGLEAVCVYDFDLGHTLRRLVISISQCPFHAPNQPTHQSQGGPALVQAVAGGKSTLMVRTHTYTHVLYLYNTIVCTCKG